MVIQYPACVLCGVTFTEPETGENRGKNTHARSSEHIFPAALGGIWKEPGLICKPCNDRAGRKLDHHLATLFRPLIAVLGVRHGRKGDIQSYEYQQDGQTFTLNPMTGEVFNLSLKRPTETEPGKLEMSVGPGMDDHVTRSLKGAAEKRGWDVTKLGTPQTSLTMTATGTTPLVLDFAVFEQAEAKAAVSKIALLGAAALLGAYRFNQLDTREFRQVVHLERPSPLVMFPDGSPMISRYGHGLTLHLLEDGRLASLVTLFGACSFLVPLAPQAPNWAADALPGRVLLPTDEHLISGFSPQMKFGGPNVQRTMAVLDRLAQEMQPYVLEQAANRRAWTAAGLRGQPGDAELSAEESELFLEHQQREYQLMGI